MWHRQRNAQTQMVCLFVDERTRFKCDRVTECTAHSVWCQVVSCAVIAVGIYLTVEKVQFVSWTMGTELVAASCYLITSAASVIFLISFLGCFGSLFKNRTILLIVRLYIPCWIRWRIAINRGSYTVHATRRRRPRARIEAGGVLGEGCTLTSQLGGLEERRELPCRVRAELPAATAF